MKNYNSIVKRVVNALLKVEESFAINRSVREWLFDGFSDPVLDVATKLRELKIVDIPIPYDKFGWFYTVSYVLNNLHSFPSFVSIY